MPGKQKLATQIHARRAACCWTPWPRVGHSRCRTFATAAARRCCGCEREMLLVLKWDYYHDYYEQGSNLLAFYLTPFIHVNKGEYIIPLVLATYTRVYICVSPAHLLPLTNFDSDPGSHIYKTSSMLTTLLKAYQVLHVRLPSSNMNTQHLLCWLFIYFVSVYKQVT